MAADFSGVRVPLGLEAVGRDKKQPGFLQRPVTLGSLSQSLGSSHFLKSFVADPVPPASSCLCPSLTPTRSSKLYRSHDYEGQAIGLGAEGAPL